MNFKTHLKRFFSGDVLAGLSVATVALPVSIAYAQMMGLSPMVGIYSCVFPMLVYAFLGTSKQMIIGPDAAICALMIAALAPWADGQTSPENYHAIVVLLTFLSGVVCLIAWRFKLGFLANLLSRPILIGLLNGVAIIIIVGQLGKIAGIAVEGQDVVGQLSSFYASIGKPHWLTVGLTVLLFVMYGVLSRLLRKAPVALVIAVFAVILSMLFDLEHYGISVVGEITSGFPTFHWPDVEREEWGGLLGSAIAIAFMSFSGMALTGRSFAAKHGDELDDDRELFATGAANIASAISQGFAISGANSRTAVSDAAGGKTQKVQVVAALIILLAAITLKRPIAYLPSAALGVILIVSAVKLADFDALLRLRKYSLSETIISLMTTLAVVVIGVMPGIFLAVLLAIVNFLTRMARPVEYHWGVMPGDPYYLVELEHHPEGQEIDGLLFYRFGAPLIFFNSGHFSRRVQASIKSTVKPVQWVVFDISSMNEIDFTGMTSIMRLCRSLTTQGYTVGITGRYTQINEWSKLRRVGLGQVPILFFRTKRDVLKAYYEMLDKAAAEKETLENEIGDEPEQEEKVQPESKIQDG